jgi:hypothetical protein
VVRGYGSEELKDVMRLSNEQMEALQDFHAFCCRHPFRINMRKAIANECCKVIGCDNDETIVSLHARSIADWMTTPHEAIKRIEELES